MAPDAPGLFSITIGCPRRCERAVARTRDVESAAPPGAAFTIRRMGLSGYSARAACEAPIRASTKAIAALRVFSTVDSKTFLRMGWDVGNVRESGSAKPWPESTQSIHE